MYAIVNISGKQFKASEGMKVRVPKQTGEQGSSLTFNEVLLLNDGTNTQLEIQSFRSYRHCYHT